MWVIAYVNEAGRLDMRGWCVVNVITWAVKAGPYATHTEAVEAAETMAFRIAQGWAP